MAKPSLKLIRGGVHLSRVAHSDNYSTSFSFRQENNKKSENWIMILAKLIIIPTSPETTALSLLPSKSEIFADKLTLSEKTS